MYSFGTAVEEELVQEELGTKRRVEVWQVKLGGDRKHLLSTVCFGRYVAEQRNTLGKGTAGEASR